MIHFRVRFERLSEHLASGQRRAGLWRAAWLALVVPAVATLGSGLGAWPWAPLAWWAAAVVVFAATAWWTTRQPDAAQLGRALDRRFGMSELLVTAIEVDRRGPQGPVEARLLDDAAVAVAWLDRGPAADPRPVRREMETTVAMGLLVAGLWLLAAAAGPLRPSQPLPPVGGGDDLTAGVGDGRDAAGAGGSGSGWSGMAAALGDHAAALGLSEALNQGDSAAAARAARALADQAPGLSPRGRADLAEALRQAAAAAPDPGLGAALSDAANTLAQPQAPAAEAVERLAAALDARAIAPGAALAISTRAPAVRAGPMVNRLAGAATPVTLGTAQPGRTGGAGMVRAASAGTTQQSDAAAVTGGSGGVAAPAGGVDPLSVPPAYRDMVARYFARSGGPP